MEKIASPVHLPRKWIAARTPADHVAASMRAGGVESAERIANTFAIASTVSPGGLADHADDGDGNCNDADSPWTAGSRPLRAIGSSPTEFPMPSVASFRTSSMSAAATGAGVPPCIGAVGGPKDRNDAHPDARNDPRAGGQVQWWLARLACASRLRAVPLVSGHWFRKSHSHGATYCPPQDAPRQCP